MKNLLRTFATLGLAFGWWNAGVTAQNSSVTAKGVLLETLTWVEAKERLSPATVVVIPLGAEAKEHGPHLKLANDWTMAEYLKNRVLERADVVVAPTINYSFYPAFVNYPGSTSLRLDTARDLIIDICTTLAAHGPKRFYVLNTGVSTQTPLKAAQALLALNGIVLRFTDILAVSGPVEKAIAQQKEGTHADEIETSWMLYIKPDSVDMTKAVAEYPTRHRAADANERCRRALFRQWCLRRCDAGDSCQGGELVEAAVAGILKEIEDLRTVRAP